MYSVNGSTLQKELVTYYNAAGQRTKQFWYWNGEKDFHNVESFYYSGDALLLSLTDSSADGNLETTSFHYDHRNLQKRVTLQNDDTSDFRVYPVKNTTIRCWYAAGRPYRFDTTIFEKENVKLEYFGREDLQNPDKEFRWHYKFKNEFDQNGNLIKVSAKVGRPYRSFARYVYDERNLLIKKQEIIFVKRKETIHAEYYFTYE
jgi:hypothetical protein